MAQIRLVPDEHDGGVGVRVLSELLEPALYILERDCAVTSSVTQRRAGMRLYRSPPCDRGHAHARNGTGSWPIRRATQTRPWSGSTHALQP